jgi:hypothetical protein
MKNRGTDLRTNGGGLDVGIVGAAWNVIEGSNQLSGRVQGSVLEEEVGEVIETTRFQVCSIVDRRGSLYKQLNGVGGTAKR